MDDDDDDDDDDDGTALICPFLWFRALLSVLNLRAGHQSRCAPSGGGLVMRDAATEEGST